MIVAASLLDWVAGDPEGMPHPVRWMGAGIVRGEALLRRDGQSPTVELVAGGVLTAGMVVASYAAAAGLLRVAHRWGRGWGAVTEVVLGWTCLAARSLDMEAKAVVGALADGDLARARMRVARIVGRDTAGLDAGEVSRAVVETVAESLSDGVMAPLFYMALGGVPMAMAYKAVNTLDSMIGHADGRYFYFGKVAARLDDVANFVPARLTAAGIVGAAAMMPWGDARAAARVWITDGGRHRSPNAGQTEAAMAGAMGVRLGGVNFYGGERLETPLLGAAGAGANVDAARRAMRVSSVVTLMGVLVAAWAAGRARGWGDPEDERRRG